MRYFAILVLDKLQLSGNHRNQSVMGCHLTEKYEAQLKHIFYVQVQSRSHIESEIGTDLDTTRKIRDRSIVSSII